MSRMKPTPDPATDPDASAPYDPDQLIDVRVAAGVLGVSVRTVWRYIDAETLPSETLAVPRGARRVKLSDVRALGAGRVVGADV